MKHCRKVLFLFLTIVLLPGFWDCNKVSRDDPEPEGRYSQELLASLNQAALPLTGSDPTLPDDELEPLADLGQALVVGLGEATHGTHEFFAMKHRLFRYLAERHGFRAFAFECDYGESIYFDRWLNGGAGDLGDLILHTMHFWTWRTPEVKALLQWMRRVNLARPEAERLHYVGVDCQFATYQPALLRAYLERVSPQRLAELEPLLAQEEAFRDAGFKEASAGQYSSLQDGLEAEYEAWKGLKNESARRSSPLEFESARQLLRSLVQVNRYRIESTTYLSLRDQYMADNTLWVQRNFGDGRGIAVWAHNAHVANDAGVNYWPSLGYRLRKDLGERYVAVGFSFCLGSFTAVGFDKTSQKYTGLQTFRIDVPPLMGSLNDLFHAADSKAFLFRLDRLTPGEPLADWFDGGRRMLSIGASFNGAPEEYYGSPFAIIGKLFDVLIHFEQTTFAPQLQTGKDAGGWQNQTDF